MEVSLEVACRAGARGMSSGRMPEPLSVIKICFLPPDSMLTVIFVAPASRLFSISSFTIEEGRSMTSPAAIFVTVTGSRILIVGMGVLSNGEEVL